MNDFSNLSAESPEDNLAQVRSDELPEVEPMPHVETCPICKNDFADCSCPHANISANLTAKEIDVAAGKLKAAIILLKTFANRMSADDLKMNPLVAKELRDIKNALTFIFDIHDSREKLLTITSK
jgi:uncharacterized protein YjaG (DUF416 family)